MNRGRAYMVAVALAVGALLAAVPLAWGDPGATKPTASGKKSSEPAAARPAKQTPLLMNVLYPPQPMKGTDGKYHLAYELVLTNSAPVTASVEWVKTKDAKTGEVVGSIAGARLADRMARLGDITGEPSGEGSVKIESGEVALVFLDVTFEKRGDVPRTIKHTVKTTFDLSSGTFNNLFPAETINSGARIRVIQEAPTVLSPPLQGKNWVVANGCCNLTPHRGAMIALNQRLVATERYAIDYFRADNKGRLVLPSEENDKNTDFPAFDEPLFAAADGEVVKVVGKYPNEKPGVLNPDYTYKDAGGNHVIIDIGDGKYLLYAHIKPGSIEVKEGQRVKSGQMIARLGNSGNTSAPHLHIQLQNVPTFPFSGDVLPYTFDKFEYQGYIGLDLTPHLLDNPQPRKKELPLTQSVEAFPTP